MNADGLLLTSKFEGMPNVVKEALYLKTVVITTNSTPILKDLIDEGVSGNIVDELHINQYVKCVLNYKKLENKFKPFKEDDLNSLFLEWE